MGLKSFGCLLAFFRSENQGKNQLPQCHWVYYLSTWISLRYGLCSSQSFLSQRLYWEALTSFSLTMLSLYWLYPEIHSLQWELLAGLTKQCSGYSRECTRKLNTGLWFLKISWVVNREILEAFPLYQERDKNIYFYY